MLRFLIAAAVAGIATAASAGDEIMTPYIGNTFTVTAPDGVTKIWYAADHTWTGQGPQGAMNGTWKTDGDQLCVTQLAPPPAANMGNGCVKLDPHTVGETWSWTQPGGGPTATMTLTAGR